jgi:hypothetical protein
MVDKQLSENDQFLDGMVTGPYKYGFKTSIESESFPKGLNIETVNKITKKKK